MANRPAIEHIFLAGSTATGKSTLLRHFSRGGCLEKVRGTDPNRDILIYDPTGHAQEHSDGWRPDVSRFWNQAPRTKQFSRPDSFVAAARRCVNTDLYVDEAADVFSLSLPDNFYLITKGRHFGNRVFVATQRPPQVAPTVRNQCTAVFMFRLGTNDRREVISDCGYDPKELKGNIAIPRAAGEYIFADKIEGAIHSAKFNR